MTRLILPIVGGLLALASGVDAKSKKDMVHLYEFTSDGCQGNPLGGNIDLVRDECVKINARSLTLEIDSKRKGWLNDVNHGHIQCGVSLYRDSGCQYKKEVATLRVPDEMGQGHCHTEEELPVTWAKFHCHPELFVYSTLTTRTIVETGTSWSVGKDDVPTPVVATKTATVVATIPVLTTVARELLPTITASFEIPELTTVAHRLQPRNVSGLDALGESYHWESVWMWHPWADSLLCYDCWSKDSRGFGWVKCNAGPLVDVDCGPKPIGPDGQPISTTTLPGATRTISTAGPGTYTFTDLTTTSSVVTLLSQEFTSTSTYVETVPPHSGVSYILPSPGPPLGPRDSWHKAVTFKNPFDGQRMCADAEWDKRGQAKTEIRIQEVRYENKGKECSNDLNLDAPGPAETTVGTTTTTTGFTNIEHSTITVTEVRTTTIPFGPFRPTSTSVTTTIFPPPQAAGDEDDTIPHSDL